jgi:hypothetical protein
MSKNMATVEMFACVDQDGDYAVGKDEDAAREAYESEFCALNETAGFRLVKVTVNVPCPEVVELTGTVADDEAPATLAVA